MIQYVLFSQYLSDEVESVDMEREKYPVNAIKLNNNMLVSWDGFTEVLTQLCTAPLQIAWIDLSFNDLRNIPLVITHIQHMMC